MELYILDSNLLRTEVVESYASLIWTERYQGYGDFQLDIDPVLADTPLTQQDTMLAIDKSDRVMYIDSVENKFQEDGTRLLIVKGKSLEAKLQERPNGYPANSNTPLVFGNGTSQTPGTIARNLITSILRTNASFVNDQMPFLQADSYSATGRIAEASDTPIIQSSVGDLYSTIKSICETYRLGFRIRRPLDDSKLYFDIYTGYDRTSGQATLPAVVFSTQLDNLTDTTELITGENYKNIAYVFALNGSLLVYGDNADSNTAGFNRKVLVVDANDIADAAGSTLTAKMTQRGKEALAAARIAMGFDGQIPQNGSYKYGTDYFLGDLVEKRSDTGIITQMRVTEQIFTSDHEGEKSYPTLVIDTLLTAGSWDAVSAAKYWDIYTTEVWDSM